MESLSPTSQLCFERDELSDRGQGKNVGMTADVVKFEGDPHLSPWRVVPSQAPSKVRDEVLLEAEHCAHSASRCIRELIAGSTIGAQFGRIDATWYSATACAFASSPRPLRLFP
jgi:hypothetical protein